MKQARIHLVVDLSVLSRFLRRAMYHRGHRRQDNVFGTWRAGAGTSSIPAGAIATHKGLVSKTLHCAKPVRLLRRVQQSGQVFGSSLFEEVEGPRKECQRRIYSQTTLGLDCVRWKARDLLFRPWENGRYVGQMRGFTTPREVQAENPVFQLFSLLAIKLCRKKEKKEIKETNAVHKRNIRKSEKYVNKRTGVFQP